MSVATEITRLANAKADIKRAINAKGGTLVNERLTEYASAIDNLVPADFRNRVRFIDFDGTTIKTMYVADGESAQAPEDPKHPGMVFQGWNCSLDNIQGHRDIGAIYTTQSGGCEFDVRMRIPTGLTVTFYPYLESGTLSIEWGDGSSDTITETGRREVSYTYADYGDYTIKMKISGDGSWYIPDSFCQWSDGIYYLTAARIAGIRRVQEYAFQYKYGLQTVTLSKDVQTIGHAAFYECRALVALVFPDTMTEIGHELLNYCYGLSQVVFSDSLTTIPDRVCHYCHTLDAVTIPDGVTHVGHYAFHYCYALSEASFPDSLQNIGEYAFSYCMALREVRIPEGLTTIQRCAFQDCYSIESVHLPDSITSMAENIFCSCRNLKSVNIPRGITSIPSSFCRHCYALEKIDIPNHITYIGDDAFYECYRLTEVRFHADITTIRSGAFRYCRAMRNYYCYRTEPPNLTSSYVFSEIPGCCMIWVPKSTDRTVLTAYKTASNWSNYANHMAEMED